MAGRIALGTAFCRLRRLEGRRLFLGLLAAFTLLRLLWVIRFPLTGDEAYYWLWSRHLAFGYYDHPPLIAWLMALTTKLAGPTLLGVRLPAVLCAAGATYLLYLLGRETGGERVGLVAGFFGLVSTLMMVASVIVSTDSPLLLFWVWTVYLVRRALKTRRGHYWYLAGLTLGLGLLAKFLIIPLIFSVFLFILLSRDDRFWLRRHEPYLALGLALLIFTPFVVWNARHHWATFAFNTMRHRTAFNPLGPLAYVFSQAFLVGLPLSVLLLRTCFRLVAEGRTDRTAWFFLLTGWGLPAFFLLSSFLEEVGAHWPAAAYPVALAGAAWVLARRDGPDMLPTRTILATFFFTLSIAAVLLVPSFLALLPLGGKNGWTAKAYVWEKLGKEVARLHREHGEDSILATGHYAFSSLLSFYTPGQPHVAVLGPGSCYGRNFDFWDDWAAWEGRDVLFLATEEIRPGSFSARVLAETCREYEPLPPIELPVAGTVARFYPALGRGVRGDPYGAVRKRYVW